MRKKLGFNSLWLLLARVGVLVFSLAFVALVAWHFGVAQFGQFSLITAIVFLANAFTTFGTDTFIVRDIARNGRATHLVADAFWLQCALAVAWVLVQQALALFLPVAEPVWLALLVYSISLWPLALFTVCSAALRGVERMDLYLLLTVLGAGLQVLATIAAILMNADMLLLLGGLVVVQVVVAGFAWWLCQQFVKGFMLQWPSNTTNLLVLLRSASPLSLLTGLTILSQRMGLFIVSSLVGDVGAGIFSASSRVNEGLKVGHQSVLGALMPSLLKRDDRSAKLFLIALWALPLAAAGLALVTTILSKPLMILLYGIQYEESAAVLSIMAWGLIPYAFNAVLSLGFIAQGGEVSLARTLVVSLLLSMLIIIVLTLRYQLPGTAWGMVVGELIQAGLLLWAYRTLRPQLQPDPVVYGL